jgi:hypothetical protein
MKLSILTALLGLVLGAGFTAPAGIYSYTGSAYSIPDGSLGGVSSQISVSGANGSLLDITVTLNMSGGYNGDLYAYLSYDGRLVPLLNRIGLSGSNPFGAAGAGMSVTLSDLGSATIHTAGDSVLGGTWRADGQTTSPTAAASSFNANGGSITLDGTFEGVNPNGAWTLFFADTVTGGGSPTLTGWSLDITAVPEPVNFALGIVAGVFLVGGLCRTQPVRNRLQRCWVGINHWLDAV